MVRGVAKHEGADEDAALTLAQDRVPHGRRIPGALDPVPGTRWRPVGRGDARFHELAAGRHLTSGGVNEEHGHGGAT